MKNIIEFIKSIFKNNNLLKVVISLFVTIISGNLFYHISTMFACILGGFVITSIVSMIIESYNSICKKESVNVKNLLYYFIGYIIAISTILFIKLY